MSIPGSIHELHAFNRKAGCGAAPLVASDTGVGVDYLEVDPTEAPELS